MYICKKAATGKEQRNEFQNDSWVLRNLVYSFTCIW